MCYAPKELFALVGGTENDGLATGRVEMTVSNLRILNAAVALPFAPGEDDVSEEVRLRHRFWI